MPNSDAWALATLPKPRKAPAAGAWGRGVGSGIPKDGRVEEMQTSMEPKEGDGDPSLFEITCLTLKSRPRVNHPHRRLPTLGAYSVPNSRLRDCPFDSCGGRLGHVK